MEKLQRPGKERGFDLEHVEAAVGSERRFQVCFTVTPGSDRLGMKTAAPQEGQCSYEPVVLPPTATITSTNETPALLFKSVQTSNRLPLI